MSTAPAGTYHPLLNLGDDLAGRQAGGGEDGVLWLHGYGLDSSCWGELWERLPDLRHVGVDLPGHGRSMPLPEGQDAPALAERLARLARARGLRHLVALSWSSILALHMASLQPDAFDSLVLGSPLPPDGTAGEPFWARYRELVNMHRIGGFGEHLRGRLMLVEPSPFDGARARPELWDALWETVGRHPFFDLEDTALLRLGLQPDDVRLHAVAVPTLIVLGGKEGVPARRHARKLEKVLPRCRRLDVVGASRLALLEVPGVAASAIESHVRSHAARPRQEES